MKDVEKFVRQDFLAGYHPYKDGRWCYEDGCTLKGCIELYKAEGDPFYRRFVLDYLDNAVQADGNIPSYITKQYSIDDINCGKALFFALDETGEEKYRKAIEFHMDRLRRHPRCVCGSFWHKETYPNQVWLDGLYMAQPFYAEYEARFDKNANLADIVAQFRTVRAHLFNEEKGLNYHGWDESLQQPWCDKVTGLSPNFWLRSTGWYLMALVDCIELVDEQLYEHYRALVDIFRESVTGILRWQDEKSGLFYQVIDRADVEGNYLETSGTAMIACAIMKGARLGVLNAEKYLPIGRDIFERLTEAKLQEQDGHLHLTDICSVAGLGPGEKRDGSVAYYLSEPIVSDDAKGVGPYMMAYAEYLKTGK